MNWLSAAIVIILLSSSSVAQHIKLNGKLLTDGKKPVPRTRIGVSGKQVGLTDANGRFSIDFAEKHFTTGRFDQCRQRLASLLTNEKLEIQIKIAFENQCAD